MSAPSPKRGPVGGGAPLALLAIAGPIVAVVAGYPPMLGVLVGLGLGISVAILIWLLGR